MYEISSLPQLLSDEQRKQANIIFERSQIALISCLFWRQDRRVLTSQRQLADSYLFFPVKGSLDCSIGSYSKVIHPGEFMMVGEGVKHSVRQADGSDWSEAFAIHTHAYTIHGKSMLSIFDTPFGKLASPEVWFEQLSLLTHLMGYDENLGRKFGEHWIRQLLLHQLVQEVSVSKQPDVMDPRIWESIESITRRYSSGITVSELARKAGVSDVHFRKLFHNCTGTTPKSYIQNFRLRRARVLLQTNPLLTIKEVAYQTGFGDPHYLHAVYKDAYGETPAACRQRKV